MSQVDAVIKTKHLHEIVLLWAFHSLYIGPRQMYTEALEVLFCVSPVENMVFSKNVSLYGYLALFLACFSVLITKNKLHSFILVKHLSCPQSLQELPFQNSVCSGYMAS